jgi:hypothetical protein
VIACRAPHTFRIPAPTDRVCKPSISLSGARVIVVR